MKINEPIFDNFNNVLEETDLFKIYKLDLIKKAKISDDSGAIYADKEQGIEVRLDLQVNTIETIFIKYYKDGKGWQEFSGKAPCGLSKNSSRANVIKQLGKADWSVEKGGIGLMAITNSADKWYDEIGNGLRVEYAEDDLSIKLISIQSKKLEDKFK